MIVHVIDAAGNVLHDCEQAGCEVSWDGYDRQTGEPAAGRSDVTRAYDEIGPGLKIRLRGESRR